MRDVNDGAREPESAALGGARGPRLHSAAGYDIIRGISPERDLKMIKRLMMMAVAVGAAMAERACRACL